MAYETYFKNFNVIQYGNSSSNTAVVDITERVITLQNVEKNPYIFYPVDITNGSRADQVAYYNFNDQFSSWVLYLTNDIVDPYYEWYLTQDQFNSFIETKYGSIANAMQTVAFWQNNWANQPALTPAAYTAEISGNIGRMKYWQPVLNSRGDIFEYARVQSDWSTSTNQVVTYSINAYSSSVSTFTSNEIVNLNGNGQAQFVQSNSSVLVVQHTFGNTTISNGYIYGTSSTANVIINGILSSVNTIPANEIAYWTPIYYYDMENIKNEGNRTIRVMQPQYVPQYITNFKQLLSVK
jgi:hypothetical protein